MTEPEWHEEHLMYCPASNGKTFCGHSPACHKIIQDGATRYDDALKRINDMQAELEYLRQEVNR